MVMEKKGYFYDFIWESVKLWVIKLLTIYYNFHDF